jgi:hypothetical protein
MLKASHPIDLDEKLDWNNGLREFRQLRYSLPLGLLRT